MSSVLLTVTNGAVLLSGFGSGSVKLAVLGEKGGSGVPPSALR